MVSEQVSVLPGVYDDEFQIQIISIAHLAHIDICSQDIPLFHLLYHSLCFEEHPRLFLCVEI